MLSSFLIETGYLIFLFSFSDLRFCNEVELIEMYIFKIQLLASILTNSKFLLL
jgi:hypothetical protein